METDGKVEPVEISATLDINLNTADKDKALKPTDRAKTSKMAQWYLYRNTAMIKIEKIKVKTVTEVLQAILVILVKIYWEMRKPKQGER